MKETVSISSLLRTRLQFFAVTNAMQATTSSNYEWLIAGKDIFPALLAGIDAAQTSVRLEIYIFQESPLAQRFLAALIRARQRGTEVRVLIDAVGSLTLPNSFWDPLRKAGGVVRIFNPVALRRFWIRNHRKLLVCDDHIAFIGGFNVAPEYEGDGVTSGWCDVGLKVAGPLVEQLALSFEEMFDRADFQHKRFIRPLRFRSKKHKKFPAEQLLFSGPGRGSNHLKRALELDLAHARNVQLTIPYFLPPRRLRRKLLQVVQRGGKVQLILPGKSDVALSLLAGQSLYRRFLDGNVEIYEYQPQILHAKIIVIDNIVYVGSSNLDPRSLHINYELMLRLEHRELAEAARKMFLCNLKHSKQITAEDWRKSRTLWRRLKQRWAYFLLNHVDPYFARRLWRTLPH